MQLMQFDDRFELIFKDRKREGGRMIEGSIYRSLGDFEGQRSMCALHV